MPAGANYRIVFQIYESKPYPVVVHIFYGATLAEAGRYYEAHLKSDSFFRGCVVNKKFNGLDCRESRTIQRWGGQRWVSVGRTTD